MLFHILLCKNILSYHYDESNAPETFPYHLMEYKTTPIAAFNCTPAQLFFGRLVQTHLPVLDKLPNRRLTAKTKNSDITGDEIFQMEINVILSNTQNYNNGIPSTPHQPSVKNVEKPKQNIDFEGGVNFDDIGNNEVGVNVQVSTPQQPQKVQHPYVIRSGRIIRPPKLYDHD
ncbi:hypothetical protein FQR65_LT04014 [Abscondita terminalis]|nr:hypothetical protein FQR65_LT04014 [Abscondita terminalis]